MIHKKETNESIIPKKAVATPEDVRRVLEITPEKEDEIKQTQARLLKLHRSRARLNPEQKRIARGIELEQHYRKIGKTDSLAEALAMQGRYEEAADIAETSELKFALAEKAEAVASDDADCKCDSFTEKKGMYLPNQFVESYGYSEKHQATMPFIRCQVCGKLNARQNLPHLDEQKKLRRESEKGTEVPADKLFRKQFNA